MPELRVSDQDIAAPLSIPAEPQAPQRLDLIFSKFLAFLNLFFTGCHVQSRQLNLDFKLFVRAFPRNETWSSQFFELPSFEVLFFFIHLDFFLVLIEIEKQPCCRSNVGYPLSHHVWFQRDPRMCHFRSTRCLEGPLSVFDSFLFLSPSFLLFPSPPCSLSLFRPPEVFFQGSLGDSLRQVRPTGFFGVPRVWEKIHEKIMAAGASTTGMKKNIATWAKALVCCFYNVGPLGSQCD
jgi:hypothetical protein